MDLERKTFQGYGLKSLDDHLGLMEAYISVFNNTDHGGDIVSPGFFDKAASKKLPKGVWAHDPTIPIAKTVQTYPVMAGDPRLPDKIRELGGQYVKAQFNLDTQRGREAFSDLKFGTIDEFSFAYWPEDYEYLDDGRRLLKSAGEWPEWSPVLQGMNPGTVLLSAKSKEGEQDAGDALPFGDDLAAVVDAVKRVTERAKARQELRLKEGRRLSTATITSMQQMRDMMGQCCDMMDELMAEESVEPGEPGMGDMGKARQEMMELELKIAIALAGTEAA